MVQKTYYGIVVTPLSTFLAILNPRSPILNEKGQEEFETSVSAFEKITKFTSCEFAVRHFIINAVEVATREFELEE